MLPDTAYKQDPTSHYTGHARVELCPSVDRLQDTAVTDRKILEEGKTALLIHIARKEIDEK
jgi:hypothetical protein